MDKKRIGILTSGGDCPGLNAAIRASTKTAIAAGYDVIGIIRGWQGLLGEKADLVARITFQDIDIDLDNSLPDIDDSGTLVSVGVRWQLIKMLEINGFVSAAEFDDIEDDFILDLNAILTFGKFGFGAGWETSNEDRDTARLFFRWMFGRGN